MKMDITFNVYEANDFCGYANVVFDEKYALEHIQLRKNADGGLYVVTPGYTNKNNERKEFFHPVSAESRKEFDTAVIKAYNQTKSTGNRKTTVVNDLPPMEISKVNAAEYERGMTIGLASVGFAKSYMLDGIQIKTGQNGEYLNLPKYTQPVLNQGSPVYDENGRPKKDYRDVFKPITKEAYEELKNTVLDKFYEKSRAAELSKERTARF